MTVCTGKRNGAPASGPSTGTVSRWSSSVGPSYQGVCSEGTTTLSPTFAETGIATTASSPYPSTSAISWNSLAMVGKAGSS